jgi:hypothetical protein
MTYLMLFLDFKLLQDLSLQSQHEQRLEQNRQHLDFRKVFWIAPSNRDFHDQRVVPKDEAHIS